MLSQMQLRTKVLGFPALAKHQAISYVQGSLKWKFTILALSKKKSTAKIKTHLFRA